MNFYFIDFLIDKFKKEFDIFYIVNFCNEIAMLKANISKH